ncbi:MAG: Cys-Gln thioester bond-forming surface protein [Bacilli bacterium]|nr:Cys-Gln thioester bond-forming surface protein [Bacilli bacterium]
MKEKIIYQKRIKSLIIVMILIITISLVKVSAGTFTLTRNKIDGIYAVAPLPDKTHLYNLEIYKIGSEIAYCIEIGKKLTDSYNATIDTNEASIITNISADKLNYLKLLIYFGYGFRNHTDYKYYMATQELVWEYLNNTDITWTNELDINGAKINIESYKNEIKSLIKEYQSSPNIPDNINCKIGDSITLIDDNKSLNFYNISNQGRQTTTKPNDNTLQININDKYIGEDIIELKTGNAYNNLPTFYYANSSQTLLSSGNLDTKKKNINLKISGETLTTNLIDKDNKSCIPSGQATLTGAKYELYDKNNNLITSFTTNDTCENTIPNLYHDTYYVKQIKSSTGYKLNDKVVEIHLTKDNNRITLEEEVIKSDIEINKLYEVENEYPKEIGIIFNIYDNNNNIYKTITTTNNKDIVTVPFGTYIIKQENTSYGYEFVKDIKLTIDENSDTEIKYNLVNKQIKSILNITTKDNISKSIIKQKNIKYKVKNKQTNKYIYTKDTNNKKITEFSTNENGELTIPTAIPYGNYIIEQTSTPDKYLENKEKITITVDENSTYTYFNNQVVINVDYYNTPIIGKINILTNTTIISKNQDNTSSKKDEIRANIEVELYQGEKIINSYKTNEEGKITIENLPLGNYCIKEKNTSNQKCITLINTDNVTPIIERNIEFTNVIKLSNATITNIDNLNNPIAGSEINLYQDDKLISGNITNHDGKITIYNLNAGKYCFKQEKVSDKYYPNNEKVCFNINNDGKDVNLDLINNLIISEKIPVPNTLSNKKNNNYLLISSILLSLGVVFYKKKKIHNN